MEVHQDEWWIRKYESYGFKYDAKLTQEIRSVATKEHLDTEVFPPNGKNITAQHVWVSMKVFINPVVAALPQHNHLFGEFGCFNTGMYIYIYIYNYTSTILRYFMLLYYRVYYTILLTLHLFVPFFF